MMAKQKGDDDSATPNNNNKINVCAAERDRGWMKATNNLQVY